MVVFPVLYVECVWDTHPLLFNFPASTFFPLHTKGLVVLLECCFTDFWTCLPFVLKWELFRGAVKVTTDPSKRKNWCFYRLFSRYMFVFLFRACAEPSFHCGLKHYEQQGVLFSLKTNKLRLNHSALPRVYCLRCTAAVSIYRACPFRTALSFYPDDSARNPSLLSGSPKEPETKRILWKKSYIFPNNHS